MSDLMTRGVIMMPLELAMSSDLSRRQFYSRAQEVLAERDTYRDLCVELLAAVKNTCALVDKMGPKSRAQADSAITKAEAIMGEKS